MLLHQLLESAQVSEACHSTPQLSLIRQARVSMGNPLRFRGGTHRLDRDSMVNYHNQGRASTGSLIRQGRASTGRPIRQGRASTDSLIRLGRASTGSLIRQGRHLEGLTLTLTCPATVSRLMATNPTASILTLSAMVQTPTVPTSTLPAMGLTPIPRARVHSSSPTKHSRVTTAVITAVTLRILTWEMVTTQATAKQVRPCLTVLAVCLTSPGIKSRPGLSTLHKCCRTSHFVASAMPSAQCAARTYARDNSLQ